MIKYTYKGTEHTVSGDTATLTTSGKYCEDDITVVASGQTINNQNKTVTPTTSQQSITADSGYTGLGTVTVNAVTNTIDNNIQAGNIKNGVNILGVTGTYTGGVTPTGTINITTNGTHDVTNYATANVNVHGTNYRIFEGDATTETSSATDYQQILAQNEIPQEFLDHWEDDTFGIILLRDNITSNLTTGNWCLSQKVGNNQAVAGSNGSIYRITNGSANSVQSTYQFKNYHTYDSPQFNGALCYDASYGLRLYQKTSSYHHPSSHWVMIMFW